MFSQTRLHSQWLVLCQSIKSHWNSTCLCPTLTTRTMQHFFRSISLRDLPITLYYVFRLATHLCPAKQGSNPNGLSDVSVGQGGQTDKNFDHLDRLSFRVFYWSVGAANHFIVRLSARYTLLSSHARLQSYYLRHGQGWSRVPRWSIPKNDSHYI